MKFVWKCDRGHVVEKRNADRRDYRGEMRWFVFCAACKRDKPISRQMAKEGSARK